jgi:hypothetical protein
MYHEYGLQSFDANLKVERYQRQMTSPPQDPSLEVSTAVRPGRKIPDSLTPMLTLRKLEEKGGGENCQLDRR